MHIIHVSCFAVVQYEPILPILVRVASLALGQWYDCPSGNEVTLKDNGKIGHN